MNNLYAHADAGEPVVRLNDYYLNGPFIIVSFGGDWDITSKDPAWCRRVARAWETAAATLETAIATAGQAPARRGKRAPK